ncbi:MAG: site-specific integrase [Burkholderiales bacterium]
MGPAEVEAFLNHLAVERRVAASTQSQALNAIVFFYDSFLGQALGQMSGLKRPQRRQRHASKPPSPRHRTDASIERNQPFHLTDATTALSPPFRRATVSFPNRCSNERR